MPARKENRRGRRPNAVVDRHAAHAARRLHCAQNGAPLRLDFLVAARHCAERLKAEIEQRACRAVDALFKDKRLLGEVLLAAHHLELAQVAELRRGNIAAAHPQVAVDALKHRVHKRVAAVLGRGALKEALVKGQRKAFADKGVRHGKVNRGRRANKRHRAVKHCNGKTGKEKGKEKGKKS